MKRRFPLWWDSWWEGWGIRLFNMNRESVVYAYTKDSPTHISADKNMYLPRQQNLFLASIWCEPFWSSLTFRYAAYSMILNHVQNKHNSLKHRASVLYSCIDWKRSVVWNNEPLLETDCVSGISSGSWAERWEGLYWLNQQKRSVWAEEGSQCFTFHPESNNKLNECMNICSSSQNLMRHVKNLLKLYSRGKWNSTHKSGRQGQWGEIAWDSKPLRAAASRDEFSM